MRIRVTAENGTMIYTLNNSRAARDLYEQLPLSIAVKNYSDDEKIFYPPKKLNTTKAAAANAVAGTLGYYAPWGDVVMFYEKFGSASGLYELGTIQSGIEFIQNLSGTIEISPVE